MIAYEKRRQPKKSLILVLVLILIVSVVLMSTQLVKKKEDTLVLNDVGLVLKLPMSKEMVQLPYKEGEIVVDYFDGKVNELPTVIEFEGVYRPSQGIYISSSAQSFEIYAALSGEVVDVHNDPLLGNSVTIQSDDLKITYQSLKECQLNKGDTVSQGSLIALSTQNIYNAALGNHLQLIVEKNGNIIDPKSVFNVK